MWGIPLNLAQSPAFDAPARPEAPMAALVDALHCLRVAVTIFDRSERLVFANQHFNYLFPSLPPRPDLLGKSYEQLIGMEIAGGEIAASDVCDPSRFILRRRAQFRDGEYRPLDIHLADGRIVEIKARRTRSGGWIALWSDVTAARHAEARLHDAIALSADAYAFFDKSDRVALCNDAYAAFFGYEKAQELSGASFAALMERAKTSTKIRHGMSPEDWLARRVAAHTAPAGTMTLELVSGTAYLMRDRATAEGGRVVVFTDVTDRHRVEAALEEQTRALAETRSEAERQAGYLADLTRRFDAAEASADTTKTTLLRNMSHELKTPLNAIIGFSDLLLAMGDRLTAEQVREYAGLIHDGGRNLLKLINQILDLTKLAAGRYDLNPVPVDVSRLLVGMHRDFLSRAETKGIALRVSMPDAALRARADDNALGAMLAQLIENALLFTPSGGEVALSAAPKGDTVSIRVADNGRGVAEEDIARILRPFEQAGRDIVNHTDGAGLGLTLVKALAEAQAGSLTIESAPGQGFAAIVNLPAAIA
jgi:two-component system cell cycle sensor histidine kinase PleC